MSFMRVDIVLRGRTEPKKKSTERTAQQRFIKTQKESRVEINRGAVDSATCDYENYAKTAE